MLYLYLVGLAIVDLVGIFSAKYWIVRHNWLYLALSIACFSLASVFLGLSTKYQEAAIVNIIWVSVSAILVTGFAYYYFKEPITILQFIGIGIILIGLIIVQWK